MVTANAVYGVPCSYAYSLKNTMNDEKAKDKIDASDRSALEAAVSQAIAWLESNPGAEKEEYEAKQKELESVAMPIMTKM
jgi:heat shock protein 1/8